MSSGTGKKRPWRRDRPIPNPYHDTQSQEIGYKLDSRYSGCLLITFALGLLAVLGVAVVAYWLTH